MKIEILSISIVFLFFGLALAPSISADVDKNSFEEDFKELEIELCGLGKKHSVKLTQHEYEKVEVLFNSIQEKLSNVESDDEAVVIFNEAIVKLNKYGLFGDISIEEIKKIVLGTYYNKRKQEISNNVLQSSKMDFENSTNSNCLIVGNVIPSPRGILNVCSLSIIQTLISTIIVRFWRNITPYGYKYYFPGLLGVPLYTISTIKALIPVSTLSVIGLGAWHDYWEEDPANGWIETYGIKGNTNTTGLFYGQFPLYQGVVHPLAEWYTCFFPGMFGYTGIKLIDFDDIGKGAKFLGYAIDVRLGPDFPSDVS